MLSESDKLVEGRSASPLIGLQPPSTNNDTMTTLLVKALRNVTMSHDAF